MIKVKFSFGYFFIIAGFLLIDSSVFAIYILLAAFLHELSHLIMLFIIKAPIKGLYLYAFRMKIELIDQLKYKSEIVVALAGPAINLIIFFMLLLLANIGINFYGSAFFAFTNLAFCILNLLPIFCLDGGRALYSLLCMNMPLHIADKIFLYISLFFLGILIFSGLLLLYYTKYNFSLLFISIFLLFGAVAKMREMG